MRGPKIKYRFNHDLLPNPSSYYASIDLKLIGNNGEWKGALCPFHNDSRPSLRVNMSSGGFICMACDTKGGDVLAFHMQYFDLPFFEAAKALGAMEEASW